MRNWWAWLGLSALVIALDQLSKQWIVNTIAYREVVPVMPSFNLTLAYNSGAAFSFLAGAGGWQRLFFSVIAIVASAVIVYLLRKHTDDKLFSLALALILGGALGNLWDRLNLGHVVDFLQLYVGEHYWPSFNVADSAITVGAALMIWDGFKKK